MVREIDLESLVEQYFLSHYNWTQSHGVKILSNLLMLIFVRYCESTKVVIDDTCWQEMLIFLCFASI